MTLGERIKYVREESTGKKLSMSDFAERVGVTSGAVSQWEKGQRVPSNSVLINISKEFGVSREWLENEEGEIFPPKDREAEVADVTASLMKSNEPLRLKVAKLLASLTDEQIAEARAIMEELLAQEENHPE